MVSPVGLKRLQPLSGFPTDYRAPRIDKIAYRSAVSVFGRQQVNKVTEGFHRPAPSLDLIRDGISEYDVKLPPKLTTVEYSMSLDSLRSEFKVSEKIIPLSFSAVAKRQDFPRTKSPGLPFSQMGYKTKNDVLDDSAAMSQITAHWKGVGLGESLGEPDSQAFSRQMISKTGKDKVRPVWGYPMQVILEEGRFFYPYLDHIKNLGRDHCYAYGLEMATGGMGYLEQIVQNEHIPHHSTFVMTDWSKFDSHVPSWLIRDCFDVIAETFDFSKEIDEYGSIYNVNALHARRRFKRMIDYFINTPIRLSSGERYKKHSGVPSGSMFTNLIDTFVNAVVNRFCIFNVTGSMPIGDVYMGDDAFCVVNGIWNVDDFSSIANYYFGFVLNVEKTISTHNPDNIHFLGYNNYHGMPRRKTDHLVASFVFPERTVRDPIETAARCAGQMFACMDSRSAYRWLQVLQHVLLEADVNSTDVDGFLHKYPDRFKFLKILGYDIKSISVTSHLWNPMGEVFTVVPPITPKRNYRPRRYDPAFLTYIVT